MKICELENCFDKLLPSSLSCEWDNDGLMVSGDSMREVKSALVTLDLTEPAVDRAIELGVDAVFTHHPFMFRSVSSLTDKNVRIALALKLIEHRISVFSYHTRLDAADGGVNDILCEKLGLFDISPLGEGELSIARMGSILTQNIDEFASKVKSVLCCSFVTLAKARGAADIVSRVAVLGGACDRQTVNAAIQARADVLVSGDVSYNNIIDANIDGVHVICAGHYHSENPVLTWFEDQLTSLGVKTYRYDCGYFKYL